MKPNSLLRLYPAALLLTIALAPAAPAATYLAASGEGGLLYTVALASGTPVVHGPFLGATTGVVRQVIVLRDQPAAILRADNGLFRIDLSNPLAPAIAASRPIPTNLMPHELVPAGPQDYVLAMYDSGLLEVIDNATLAARQTFDMEAFRHGGFLTPGESTLVTWGDQVDIGSGPPGGGGSFASSFDPESGLGVETQQPTSATRSDRIVTISPNAKTLVFLENFHFFRPDGQSGIPDQYVPVIDTFEATPRGLVHRENHMPSGDRMLEGPLFTRGGRQLLYLQTANHEVDPASVSRLFRFDLAGPGDLEEGEPVTLASVPLDMSMARAAGGHRVYISTGGLPGAGALHVYDAASGALAQSFTIGVRLLNLQVFETGAAVFADGFEAGTVAAWDASFP